MSIVKSLPTWLLVIAAIVLAFYFFPGLRAKAAGILPFPVPGL